MFLLALILSFATLAMAQSASTARVLLYTATAGFRHDSIPTAVQALKNAGPSINVQFDNTEDRTTFNDDNLSRYDAVVFLSTTGEVLDDSGKSALQKYLNNGGNFAGIHSASDSLVNTTFYGREIGAYFDYHANLQPATINVVGPSHPATNDLPRRWQLQDEWYNFKSDPRAIGATVILSVDESTYTDTGTRRYNQGTPHPTAWYQEHGAGVSQGGTAGRSFYTSLGHMSETWQDATFMKHILGGISWILQSGTTKASNGSATVGNAASLVATSSSSAGNPTTTPRPPSGQASGNGAASNKMASGLIGALMMFMGVLAMSV